MLESKEKLYAAEMASEQQRFKLKEAQGLDVGAVRSLQDEVAALKQKNDSRGAEIEEMEAEKYTMAEDIENLQEELEDANRQQKKYYEALMAKDEQVQAKCGHAEQCTLPSPLSLLCRRPLRAPATPPAPPESRLTPIPRCTGPIAQGHVQAAAKGGGAFAV